MNEGSFTEVGAVPTDALTLTIPALFGARAISCLAVGDRNAPAVRGTLLGPIGGACPASILRQHPAAVLHLDPVSASLLSP